MIYYNSALFFEEKTDDAIGKTFEPIGVLIVEVIDGKKFKEEDYEDGFIKIHNILFELLGVERLTNENRRLIRRNN